MPRIQWPDFRPDLASLDQNVSATITNVVPGANSYRPLPSSSPYSDALAADPTGLWLAKTEAGDFQAFAGTASNLYKLGGTSWTSIGSGYSVPTDEFWAGAQFGTNFYWNNASDGLLSFDVEAGSAVAAVGGSSQAAKAMDVVEEYLCVGNTATSSRQFQWSDTNAGSTWSGGNSGSQTFPDGGAISAICGAANIVIQEHIIRRIIPDPGGDIFQFEKLEQSKGSISPQSVIRFGETIAYLAEDGFWWAGEPIGQNAVNRFFLSSIDQNQLYTVLGRFDPNRPLFWWHYRLGETSTYNRALIYNWMTKRWADVSMSVLFASESATTGITLEQLSASYPDIETVPYSLDSRVWLGGRPVYAVIDTDKKLAFLDGTNLAATLDTGDREFIPGYRSRVKGARPLVNNAAATVRVGGRNRLATANSYGSAISQQTSGRCPLNKGGRYHRFRMEIPAGESWTFTQGIEIPDADITRDGMR